VCDALQVDVDQVEPMLQQLAVEIESHEEELGKLRETIGTERNELQRMDGSDRAAEAQERLEQLVAQIRNDAEQYVRLHVAACVLRAAIERFREKNQGPVLQRASESFSELTLGSFIGLTADFNDKGDAALVGLRPDGRTVGVEGMSAGTCDQLYLALRLASLETYLDDNEPFPFVIDDILIMFDDDRAVAALKLLARLSERTQVIFFSHHEHLVQLAEENLDDDVFFIHRLGQQKRGRVRDAGSDARDVRVKQTLDLESRNS
jgi:uncharacterized protein YhaN